MPTQACAQNVWELPEDEIEDVCPDCECPVPYERPDRYRCPTCGKTLRDGDEQKDRLSDWLVFRPCEMRRV
jgi:hypothetical protein